MALMKNANGNWASAGERIRPDGALRFKAFCLALMGVIAIAGCPGAMEPPEEEILPSSAGTDEGSADEAGSKALSDDNVLEQVPRASDCGSPLITIPIEDCGRCVDDVECADSVFCNGSETCDGTGLCRLAADRPCPGQVCKEATDTCVCPLSLEKAADCAVLQLGDGKVTMTGGPGKVVGDVCLGPNALFFISGEQVVTQTVRLDAGATLKQHGATSIGAVLTGEDLAEEIQDALSGSASAESQSCINLGTLDTTQTICGAGGLNVYCVDNIDLRHGEVITLAGSASDMFILNVAGDFEYRGGARIVAGGDVEPSHILYNIMGTGDDVRQSGGGGGEDCCNAIIDGTILALERDVDLNSGLVNGTVISGRDIRIPAGGGVEGVAAGCPSVSGSVDVACLESFSVGLGLDADTMAQLLTDWGYPAFGIAEVLLALYEMPAPDASALLKDLDHANTEVGLALQTAYNEDALGAAETLLAAGCATLDVGLVLRVVYSESAASVAGILHDAGAGIEDVLEVLEQLYGVDRTTSCAEGIMVTAGFPINSILAITTLPKIEQFAPVVYHRDEPADGFPMSAQEFFEAMLCGDETEGRCSVSGEMCEADDGCSMGESCIFGGPDSVCHPSECDPGSTSGADLIVEACEASNPFENNNFDKILAGEVPTYFSVTSVAENESGEIVEAAGGGQLRMRYWWFYGHQHPCFRSDGSAIDFINDKLDDFGLDSLQIDDFAIFGQHISDWEHVDVITSEDRSRVIAVTYFQHNGMYTQPAADIEIEGGRPVVYAGQVAHGSFHTPFHPDDLFGIPEGIIPGEPCVYFGDPRNKGANTHRWNTSNNLVSLTGDAESWMAADKTAEWLWGYEAVGTHPTVVLPDCTADACKGIGPIPWMDAGCFRSYCPPGEKEWTALPDAEIECCCDPPGLPEVCLSIDTDVFDDVLGLIDDLLDDAGLNLGYGLLYDNLSSSPMCGTEEEWSVSVDLGVCNASCSVEYLEPTRYRDFRLPATDDGFE